MTVRIARKFLSSLLILFALAWSAHADADDAASPDPAAAQELRAAWVAGAKAATPGPTTIKLLDQARVGLAADELFIPAEQAQRIMRALGNGEDPHTVGLVVSRKHDANWMILVRWISEGYVRDGDAKEWQADALLENLRAGTEAGNKDRTGLGLPAMEITGWVEPPAYDSNEHRLVWSLAARDVGAPAGQPQTINYNTYALGRSGYFSLDLVTDSGAITSDKSAVRVLLGTLDFLPGHRYADFDGSTDKVAAYGLAALVGAVAVKKLGLLALTGLFFLKIWKPCLVAIVGAGAALRRFFNRRRSGQESA